jgi:DNA-binding NarL/FixJ family response regulator
MTSRLQFVVADDHRMFAEALRLLLQPLGDVLAVAQTKDGLIRLVHEKRPNFIITDVTLPDGTGIEAIRQLRHAGVRTPMLLVTVHADELLEREAIKAGANGYVLKSAAFGDLVEAIAAVRRGQRYVSRPAAEEPSTHSPLECLSVRELQVLRLMADRRTGDEIAVALGISARTVKFHKERMRERLGTSTSTDAVNLYRSLIST